MRPETLLGPNGTEAWQLHGVGLDDAEGLPEVLHAGMAVAYELMFTVDRDGFYLEDMARRDRQRRGSDDTGVALHGSREIEAAMAAEGKSRPRCAVCQIACG